MKRILAASILAFSGFTGVQAAPITLTGLDLLNSGAISFPNGAPSLVNGTSIQFTSPSALAVLFSLSLGGLVKNPSHLVAQVNLTRRSVDHDPTFGLSDGQSFVGGIFADNEGGRLLYETANVSSAGTNLQNAVLPVLRDGVGYPAVGGPAFSGELALQIETTGTSGTIGLFGTNIDFDTNVILSPDSGLSFVFAGHNTGEVYQLNSITLDSVPVSEPGTLALFGFGLIGLGVGWNRRQIRPASD